MSDEHGQRADRREGEGAGVGTPDEAALVRRLALRLLGAPAWYPGAPSPADVALIVGRVPEGLPVDVPLPDGATVLGGLMRGAQSVTIVLDAAQRPEEVVAFYRERLLAAGWTAPEEMFPHGGFAFSGGAAPAGSVGAQGLFCASVRGPGLRVYAVAPDPQSEEASAVAGSAAEAARSTAVRLELHLEARNSPCATHTQRPGSFGAWLPTLAAPAGARQMGSGASGSPDRLSSSAWVETRLDLAELAAHYTAQLEGAGWRPEEEGVAGRAAWSSWRLEHEGEPWRGLLYALDRPDVPGQFLVHLQAEWVDAGPAPSWGTSSSLVVPR